MNLQHLKWTKNIKPKGDESWAYEQFGVGSLFKIAWRDGEANASKPQREDLILLRQKAFVTHLVKVLDYKPERETGQSEFDIYRIVEVLWVIAWDNPPVSTKADEVFGYSEVLNYQGGNVMELENIISKHWKSKGGLEPFRNHVLSQLNLV